MVKRDAAYDYIRSIAMIAIVLCHFFQIRHNYAVFSWLNIGVQVFLVLSAKLMCQKEMTTWTQVFAFYKTRLLRILLPVWIYLLCLVPVLFLAGRGPAVSAIVLYAVGLAGFAPTGVLGLGHFWYITVLLLCYLLVPLLCRIDRISNRWSALLKAVCVILPILVFVMTPWVYFGCNMALFIAAYFLFRPMGEDPLWSRKLTLRLLPLAVLAIGVRLYLDGLQNPNSQVYELGSTIAKAVIGLFLFALLYLLFSCLGKTSDSRAIRMLSNTSYEVYIVHQFILLALYEYVPFFRGEDLVNGLALLGAALLLITGNTAVLYFIKNKILSRLKRRTRR